MKRVIAVSDSHGAVQTLEQVLEDALKRGAVDAVAFAGDGYEDFERLSSLILKRCPNARVYGVRGNNDWRAFAPEELVFSVGGVIFYLCHGHRLHVKYGLQRLSYAARERDARVAIYGHTHIADVQEADGITIINPGAVCFRPCYADIRIDENGTVSVEIVKE